MTAANPLRGEALLAIAGKTLLLRPTFNALVAAEEELGPLFALVERASGGHLRLSELTTLFWHCIPEPHGISREDVGAAVVEAGLVKCSGPLRVLLSQILQGGK